MKPNACGINGLPFFWEGGGNKYGNLTLQTVEVSNLKNKIKFGHETRGILTRERLRWRGPAATEITDLSSRQRGLPIITNPELPKDNFKAK
jgi:hypothetical protein